MSATLAVAFSVLMRTELAEPGLPIFPDGQPWKTAVSIHGLTMIFFVIMPVLIGGAATRSGRS